MKNNHVLIDYENVQPSIAVALAQPVFKVWVFVGAQQAKVNFEFLRVCAISRASNSSSGGLSEKWAVEYHGTPEMRAKNLASPARIQHADLADIVKMMDLKTGGAHQDPVNEAQALLRKVADRSAREGRE